MKNKYIGKFIEGAFSFTLAHGPILWRLDVLNTMKIDIVINGISACIVTLTERLVIRLSL